MGVPKPARNHLFFPPRGAARPTLRQVLSEPNLRREFLGQGPEHEEDRAAAAPEAYRRGLEEIYQELDRKTVARKQSQDREKELDKIKRRAQSDKWNPLAGPAWAPLQPGGYFEDMRAKTDTEVVPVASNPSRGKAQPQRWMSKNGWDNDYVNDRGQRLTLFGTKSRHRLMKTERVFADRLETRLGTIDAQSKEDALARTTGTGKRKAIMAKIDPHSALVREQDHWWDQSITTHEYFSKPAPDPPKTNINPGLGTYVTQPERTTSFERDFIGGDENRVSHWRVPAPGKVAGSQQQYEEARIKLCPAGCPNLLPPSCRKRHTTWRRENLSISSTLRRSASEG